MARRTGIVSAFGWGHSTEFEEEEGLSIFGAEVIGTALLILLGNGVVAGVLLNLSKAQNGGWIVITWGWGLGVMTAVLVVGQFSGAHLNPAVTIGFAVEGRTDWGDVPEYFAGEFVGAFVGATLVWLAYLDHWRETEDPGLKLACFSTAPAIRNPVSNMITEIIGTFVLVFGILGFFATAGTTLTNLGGLLVGLLVLGIGLSLGGPTGYAINPARDLGPRIMHAILPIAGKGPSDWAYAWVPVLGPLIGGALGGVAFELFFPSDLVELNGAATE
jgi:glycerol uptake facilitator protein